MRKVAYYLLGAYLAIVPFVFATLAMIQLSYTSLDNYEWAACGVVIYGIYFIYMLWMFED